MVHIDGQRRGGEPGFGGLLISRFTDRETLWRDIDALREIGVMVVDPHTWRLGGHGSLDDVLALARRHDPKGLLNPGKL